MITCGISTSFEELSPTSGQVTYVLLSRSPLVLSLAALDPFDLHVLCTPPAFVLSQDQTLRQKFRPSLDGPHSFEFDLVPNVFDEWSARMRVPATFQLLKIDAPDLPIGLWPRALTRTFIIPLRARERQPSGTPFRKL